LVLAFGLIVCLPKAGSAVPIGTAFTYQGRLIDANKPADSLYDLQFKLYDANVAGTQKGSTIDVNELDVIDGYFTVLLDFGSNVFDGNTVWLEIGVRPGKMNDPNIYTTLSPRQEITPTPYALQTRGLFVDSALNVGIGTTSPVATLDVTNAGGHTAISGKSPWIGVWGIHNSTTGTFPGVWGDTDSLSSQASGVRGKVTSTTPGSLSAGIWGINAGTGSNSFGVRGTHDGSGTGVWGSAAGNTGIGVQGQASNSGNYTNYGGYFKAAGSTGRGVYGASTNTGNYQNYGGYFSSAGSSGRGVFGEASNSGDYTNYGGYFKAAGGYGSGVFGMATGSNGRGVDGWASNSGDYTNYGGYFLAAGSSGRGIYGVASNSGNFTNYGGYFEAAGSSGRGVYSLATGNTGIGVYGRATGSSGIGVYGNGGNYDFYAAGPGTNYGSPSSIRWKSDIRPIDEPLGKVARLRGVYFNWDGEHGGQHDVGMVAEEVGKVLPEIVEYEENGIDATGMDYGKLTPLLVEAVKALKAENDALKKRIEALEAKM